MYIKGRHLLLFRLYCFGHFNRLLRVNNNTLQSITTNPLISFQSKAYNYIKSDFELTQPISWQKCLFNTSCSVSRTDYPAWVLNEKQIKTCILVTPSFHGPCQKMTEDILNLFDTYIKYVVFWFSKQFPYLIIKKKTYKKNRQIFTAYLCYVPSFYVF